MICEVDGRPELAAALRLASPRRATYVRRELAALCRDAYLDYVIESTLHRYGQVAFERAQPVPGRIDALAHPPDRHADEGAG